MLYIHFQNYIRRIHESSALRFGIKLHSEHKQQVSLLERSWVARKFIEAQSERMQGRWSKENLAIWLTILVVSFCMPNKLSVPVIGTNGRVYTCSTKDFFAFESNGSVAWHIYLNYTCNANLAPTIDGSGMIYVVAEEKVLSIQPPINKTAKPHGKIFFDAQSQLKIPDVISGVSVSSWSSSLYINTQRQGIFVFLLDGTPLWSTGGGLLNATFQSSLDYTHRCRHNKTECYFLSSPAIDQCDGSIFILSSDGWLYSFSAWKPLTNWVKDFSAFDNMITITPGNNGRVYLAVVQKALILALDASTGHVIWQKNVGPLSTEQCTLVVDIMGWVSVGSLDGYVYSVSPSGTVNKFLKDTAVDSVIQVNPVLDCSGAAIYIAQLRMTSKTYHVVDGSIFVSTLQPLDLTIQMLVPAYGTVYWTTNYPGEMSAVFSQTYLRHFVLDTRLLLSFISASNMGKVAPCYSTYEKLMYSCAQLDWDSSAVIIYPGNKKQILLFYGVVFLVLLVLSGGIWFSYKLWRKRTFAAIMNRRVRHERFLEKRRSLQMRNRVYDEIVSALKDQVSHQPNSQALKDELKFFMQERDAVQQTLSSKYSLPKGKTSHTGILPLLEEMNDNSPVERKKHGNSRLFHTLSGSSSDECSNDQIDINTSPVQPTIWSNSPISVRPKKVDTLSQTSQSSSKRVRGCIVEYESNLTPLPPPQSYWRPSIAQKHSSSSKVLGEDEDDENGVDNDNDDIGTGSDTDNQVKNDKTEQHPGNSSHTLLKGIERESSSSCSNNSNADIYSIFEDPQQIKFMNPLFGNSLPEENRHQQYQQQKQQKKERKRLPLPRKRAVAGDHKLNTSHSQS